MSEPQALNPNVKMQHVVITLADGRKGIFVGPELITAAELKLKPPVLTNIDFSEPRFFEPRDVAPTTETPKEVAPNEPPSEDTGSK